MSQTDRRRPPDEAGAILPIALFGILVISLLVASALLTASSELVLSRAYQEGLRSLHDADAALEGFIATGVFENGVEGTRVIRSTGKARSDHSFDITLTALGQGEVAEDSAGTLSRRDLFSVVAEPSDGRGRVVGALLETFRTAPLFRSVVDAAVTVGGDAAIGAGATLAALPQTSSECAAVESPLAARLASGGIVSGAGSGTPTGGVRQDTLAAAALVEQTLTGSWAELSLGAEQYFGPAYGEAGFSSFYGPRHDAASPAYRWGCPASLVFACPAAAASEAPIIVIDAAGGEVEIGGGYGQGVLIVRSGHALLSGDFRFAGLVLVEGHLSVLGDAQIMGAVVVGEDLDLGTRMESGTSSPAIVFDGCSIARAERALSVARLERAPQTLDSATFGWYEVVR